MTDAVMLECPDVVRAYLTLAAGEDRTAATPLFARDAHVTDDGHDCVGTAEIARRRRPYCTPGNLADRTRAPVGDARNGTSVCPSSLGRTVRSVTIGERAGRHAHGVLEVAYEMRLVGVPEDGGDLGQRTGLLAQAARGFL